MATTSIRQHDDPSARPTPATRRRAVTSLEVLVAFSLIATVISLSVPLVVRHGRMLTSARHYRLAVDELTNQLEHVAALPPEEIDAAIAGIEVSEFTAEKLPGAELSAELLDADFARRVTLHIVWDEPQRRASPLSMTAWVAAGEKSHAETPRNATPAEEQP